MRKKIMATILGTAMLLTAVSFTGCGRSVKDSTSAKTEKTTKETKRDENIEKKTKDGGRTKRREDRNKNTFKI